MIPSKAPYICPNQQDEGISVKDIAIALHDKANYLLSVDQVEGKSMCETLFYQGAVEKSELVTIPNYLVE